MIQNRREAETPEPSLRDTDGAYVIDATLLGGLLGIPASRVPVLMRERVITSVCERGVDDNAGEYRLTFFYRNRRARLGLDSTGRILRKSVIDFGDRPIPDALHRSGG